MPSYPGMEPAEAYLQERTVRGMRSGRRLEPGSMAERVRELGASPGPLSWAELYGSPAFDTELGWAPVDAYLRCELSHAQACQQLRRNAHTALATSFGSLSGEGAGAAAVEATNWPNILHESALATYRCWCEGDRPGLDLSEPEEYALALETAERVAYAAWAAGEVAQGA